MTGRPIYQTINGFKLPATISPEIFKSAEAYIPDDGEIILSAYPKCGTTWVQQIVFLILRRGQPPESCEDYFKSLPFIEMVGEEGVKKMRRPGCVKMHLPFDRINFSKKAKYIYVARHPADCVVSYFHHTRFFPIYYFSDGTFEDFFELFLRGEVDFNDYFDNLLSWYEKRDEPNIFFTTYEEMKANTKEMVLKIARFLGEEHHQKLLHNDGEVLDKVLKYSSMQYMKSTVDLYWRQVLDMNGTFLNDDFVKVLKDAYSKGHRIVGDFVRAGQIGESKIVLTKSQLERLQERIREKTSQSDVMDLWK